MRSRFAHGFLILKKFAGGKQTQLFNLLYLSLRQVPENLQQIACKYLFFAAAVDHVSVKLLQQDVLNLNECTNMPDLAERVCPASNHSQTGY